MADFKDLQPIVPSKKTEEDIRATIIEPAIIKAGWDNVTQIYREYYFTDGRIMTVANGYVRDKAKKVDFLLVNKEHLPLAIVEAKSPQKSKGTGIQQSIDYSETLGVPFVYCSNGSCFEEHDNITGTERTVALDEFPSPEELHQRWIKESNYTEEQLNIIEQPYYYDTDSHTPRYYQRIVINKTLEAIAKGEKRVMFVMATGTGKTFTAFQIIHSLLEAKKVKRVLYLADRNVLIDQTMEQDFKPFQRYMTKIQDKNMDSSYVIYMSLYHQMVDYKREKQPFEEFSPDFFDLILVDECHRGSAKDDSEWRKILEYYKPAIQIGMTATPKRKEDGDNYDYFGEPVYVYSLKNGIDDGFLAPYRVTRSFINVDLDGYIPEDGEVDLDGKPFDKDRYTQTDFGKNLCISLRRHIIAQRITKKLNELGRYTKTIVFCASEEEADEMRKELVNLNKDICRVHSDYIVRITSNDDYGKKKLSYFINANEKFPTIATTVELLSTGVDCKTVGLIVIDREISSMTMFKQIIGRGTRIREDKGKFSFSILDFRGVTELFQDKEFDGEPEQPVGETKVDGKNINDDNGEKGTTAGSGGNVQPPHSSKEKYHVNGKDIEIVHEKVSYLGIDGKLITESFTDYTRKNIRGQFPNLNDFIKRWNEAERKTAVIDEMAENGILIDALRKQYPQFNDMDVFDLVCHLAFDAKVITRKERVRKVKESGYLKKYKDDALKVIEGLLDKYADNGIIDFEKLETLKLAPFSKIGNEVKILKLFNGKKGFNETIQEIEKLIYIA